MVDDATTSLLIQSDVELNRFAVGLLHLSHDSLLADHLLVTHFLQVFRLD